MVKYKPPERVRFRNILDRLLQQASLLGAFDRCKNREGFYESLDRDAIEDTHEIAVRAADTFCTGTDRHLEDWVIAAICDFTNTSAACMVPVLTQPDNRGQLRKILQRL